MDDKEPLVIAELDDLSSVFAPLKSTTRVKYTAFNVSANLLVIGASSGGLYVFRREPCVFLQLIPSKEGPVAQIAISQDERMIGVATIRGTVSLVERNQKGTRVVASSYEHSGTAITALTWGTGELFAGDASGRVSVIARTVFQPPAALLMQLDSRIVQLDAHSGLLLASTLTRCYVCDTERELYRQVGQKLREGSFGGCFLTTDANNETVTESQGAAERARGFFSDSEKTNLDYSHLKHLRIFCCRPGTRLWEVDAEGTVLRTHHFKEALAMPPRQITTDRSVDNNNRLLLKDNDLHFNFGRLFVILTRYLLTYTSDAIFILDAEQSDVVLWCNQIRDIVDLRVTSNVIYIWCANGKMHALNLVPLEKFLIRMYFWKKYQIVAELCLEFLEHLVKIAPNSSKLYLLKDLDDKLIGQQDAHQGTLERLAPFFELLRAQEKNTRIQHAQKLESGIYQITRPSYLNLKNRSHSVSPDRVNKPAHGSCSSLPELVMEEEEEQVNINSKQIGDVIAMCPLTPKPECVYEFLKRVLRLSCDEEIRPIPFRSIFRPENILEISDAFHTALTSKAIISFLREQPTPDVVVKHPEYLINTIDPDLLTLDLKMSRLLRIFLNIIDETRIVSDLKMTIPRCYFLSILEIIGRFEATTMNLSDALSPPRMLSVVAFLLKVGQSDQISRWANKLDLQDVMYLALNQDTDSKTAIVSFLFILDKTSYSNWLKLEPFVVYCLSRLESGGACGCGFPLPAPPSSERHRFVSIGTHILESKQMDAVAAVKICGSVPWLWHQLLALRSSDDVLTLLPLILHLGDLNELERRLPEMSDLVCEVLVRHLAGLYRGNCLNCGRKLPAGVEPQVTWTQAALLLLKAVGHTRTLNLLAQYQSDVSNLEPVFHRAVVLSALMEKHSSGLRYGVVDVLAGRSQQTLVMSPLLQAEIFPNTPIASPNQDSHFGLRLDTKQKCRVCSLQLSAKVFTEAGIIAFRCQHAFHAVCLRNRESCPYCTE